MGTSLVPSIETSVPTPEGGRVESGFGGDMIPGRAARSIYDPGERKLGRTVK